MRALVCREYGSFEDLVIEDRDDPVPGDHEIAIDVRAAALRVLLDGNPEESTQPAAFSRPRTQSD